eukprot:g46311.t1
MSFAPLSAYLFADFPCSVHKVTQRPGLVIPKTNQKNGDLFGTLILFALCPSLSLIHNFQMRVGAQYVSGIPFLLVQEILLSVHLVLDMHTCTYEVRTSNTSRRTATCDEKAFGPQEIIEFPLILLEVATGKVVETNHEYVRPVHNPELTHSARNLQG